MKSDSGPPPPANHDSTLVQVSGTVERVTYYNEENGYSVVRLAPDARGMLVYPYASGRDGLLTVVGNLPELGVGEWVKVTGRWQRHAQHGHQFQATQCETTLPASTEGIKRYLGSGLIRGVGRVMAERIVSHFGEQTLEVIEHEPARLRVVLGVGEKRVEGIIKAWQEQKAIKQVMIFLQSHAISTSLATKIYKHYGDESLAVVRETPYRLVRDIHGVGFKTADKIAQALGLKVDDPGRIEAGIAYTLNRMAEEGHVYVPQAELEPESSQILGVATDKVAAVINSLESEDFIKRETIRYEIQQPNQPPTVKEEQAVYLTPFYYSEIGVTNRVRRMVGHPTSRLRPLQLLLNKGQVVIRPGQIQLAEKQLEAVQSAIRHKVTILTGGPGTGKTVTVRTLLDVLDKGNYSYALASPTGRAAKRLSEATGRPAKTVHRLLEFSPGQGFGRNDDNPLDVDLVVVDECSMLDLLLANNLLKAIRPDSHLVLVGDVDQLPSVGAGDVLRDLIGSGAVAVVRLETIFRQAAGSLIIQNAHRINQGEMPLSRPETTDFFIFIKEEPQEVAELLVDIVQNRLPDKFKLNSLDDVQVVSPMYQGVTGVSSLNEKLQEALNPAGGRKIERRLGGRLFRVGDKVMQTVNNYDKNVYNGDIGRITAIDLIQQTMTLNIDGTPVLYDFLEVDELVHAYAISVHKSQGSEYPCVVMPVTTQHYLMLQRNLLYTAITRAKKLVILVGTRKAIAIAVNNNKISQRYTALDWRLRGK